MVFVCLFICLPYYIQLLTGLLSLSFYSVACCLFVCSLFVSQPPAPVLMYLHVQVLEVSRLLGLDTREYDEEASISRGMGETLILLIRAGLEQNDSTVALKLCQEVIRMRLSTGWSVCR